MTFRARLALASTVAVVVAILLAATASYVAARNSLTEAADSTLQSAANHILAGNDISATAATVGQVLNATGAVLSGQDQLPVTPQVRLVAAGLAPSFFTTVDVNGNQLRELVVPLIGGKNIEGQPLKSDGALQIATLFNGGTELHKLGIVLGLIALAGVALALLLGWLVARTALVPLNSLTHSVEGLAVTATATPTQRLAPGGADELGRLRRSFNGLLDSLESSRRAQNQLVLDASHELRTPLTSLRTNLEVIRRVDELSEADRSILVDDVLVQMQELTDLVGDMAELARGEQVPVAREPLRLDLLVTEAVNVATTHGRTQDVTFELDGAESWVEANADRLARAIGNLLDNARKWSPPGGTVSVRCRDGEVVVRDHGPGIAAEDLPHIFDRFYRSTAARSQPGSGLGLAIVSQVVHEEGGTIAAEAAAGGGTRMILRLPTVARPADADDDGEPTPGGLTPGPSSGGEGQRDEARAPASMSSIRFPNGSST
ncbi:MAG TPA: HAMP domain-containing sensor histidine kinase [Acidimicrobiales bacterium]|nr:HAMP domain-containing sensor histidine kinase [Acidimicrobiales bacterium]